MPKVYVHKVKTPFYNNGKYVQRNVVLELNDEEVKELEAQGAVLVAYAEKVEVEDSNSEAEEKAALLKQAVEVYTKHAHHVDVQPSALPPVKTEEPKRKAQSKKQSKTKYKRNKKKEPSE